MLRETQSAADASTASLPSGAPLSAATALLGGSSSTTTARVLAPLTDRLARIPSLSTRSRTLGFTDPTTGSTFDPDATIAFLNDTIFTDANYLGDGIYKVPANLACEQPFDPTTGLPTTTIDPACVQQFDKIQLRIRVAEDDGLRFFLQIDPNHDEPLSVLLRSDEVAISVNLDDASDAMISLAGLFGEQAPNAPRQAK